MMRVRIAMLCLGLATCGPLASASAQRPTHRTIVRPVSVASELSPWMTADTTMRRARVTLRAGSAQAPQPELNFNGTSMGELEFIVPQGWTVELAFSNVGQTLHSARVVQAEELQVTLDRAAITGAETPRSAQGLEPGRSHTIIFRAARPGHYKVSCAVAAHGYAGMWVYLTVDAAASRPRVLTHAESGQSSEVTPSPRPH